tara:strand:+ start:2086 stop:2583 length:498 start_codon:yes stop_codon:yes gene_type:complete
LIVGIDNGLDGGICAIAKFDGSLIAKTAMPTKWVHKKREVDTIKIKEWLLDFNTPFLIAVEEPLAHAKSSQAVRSMALSFGKIIGMAETNQYDVLRVSVHKWQKSMLGYRPKGKTKETALSVAESIAPEESWLKNKRCRRPHDGMVDAFLIARYVWGLKNIEKSL